MLFVPDYSPWSGQANLLASVTSLLQTAAAADEELIAKTVSNMQADLEAGACECHGTSVELKSAADRADTAVEVHCVLLA